MERVLERQHWKGDFITLVQDPEDTYWPPLSHCDDCKLLEEENFYLEPKNGLFVLIVYSNKFFSTTTHVKENYFKLSTGIEKMYLSRSLSRENTSGKIVKKKLKM